MSFIRNSFMLWQLMSFYSGPTFTVLVMLTIECA